MHLTDNKDMVYNVVRDVWKEESVTTLIKEENNIWAQNHSILHIFLPLMNTCMHKHYRFLSFFLFELFRLESETKKTWYNVEVTTPHIPCPLPRMRSIQPRTLQTHNLFVYTMQNPLPIYHHCLSASSMLL